MIDLKLFRKVNKIGQAELAAFLGVTVPSISAYETGRSNLSKESENRLINNTRGWKVPDAVMVPDDAIVYSEKNQNWPAIVSELSARLDAQNTQIDRLLTIVEQLTTQKK